VEDATRVDAVFEMTKPGSNCWYEFVEPTSLKRVTVQVGVLVSKRANAICQGLARV
jgi:hypothetical protein